MNFQTMSKQRKFILILAIIGVISIFLPWYSVALYNMSINGFHGSGIVVFLAFVCAVIVALMGDQTKSLDRTMWMVALVAGGLAFLITLIDTASSGLGFGFAGIGFWIALIASAGVTLSAWVFKGAGITLKEGIDELKKNISNSVNSASTTHTSGNPNKVAELEKLIELKNQGKITEEEYEQFKSKL